MEALYIPRSGARALLLRLAIPAIRARPNTRPFIGQPFVHFWLKAGSDSPIIGHLINNRDFCCDPQMCSVESDASTTVIPWQPEPKLASKTRQKAFR